jgi:hypothetical protein
VRVRCRGRVLARVGGHRCRGRCRYRGRDSGRGRGRVSLGWG